MLNLMDKRKVVQIPLERVAPNPAQPRQVFREEELRGLAESLRQNGLLQPISVRKNLSLIHISRAGEAAKHRRRSGLLPPVKRSTAFAGCQAVSLCRRAAEA